METRLKQHLQRLLMWTLWMKKKTEKYIIAIDRLCWKIILLRWASKDAGIVYNKLKVI